MTPERLATQRKRGSEEKKNDGTIKKNDRDLSTRKLWR